MAYTYIYNNPRPLNYGVEGGSDCVGVIDGDGYIYRGKTTGTYGDRIGFVDDEGYVYDEAHPYRPMGNGSGDPVGWVDSDGYVYNEKRPYMRGSSSSSCIGWVDDDGYVYNEARPYMRGSTSSSCIGKVSGGYGSDLRHAGAALLLLSSLGGSSYSSGGSSYSSGGSSSGGYSGGGYSGGSSGGDGCLSALIAGLVVGGIGWMILKFIWNWLCGKYF